MPTPERDISDILETLDIAGREGPIRTNMQETAVEALEDGKVLFFPRLAFDLSPEESGFLRPAVAEKNAKNVSLDPATGVLKHATLPAEDQAKLASMLRRYSDYAQKLLGMVLAPYAAAVEIGRTSFRPVETHGRSSSPRKDDTRLHVDAFPSTPLAGKRILRMFTNINPRGEARHWRLGAPFEQVASTFLGKIPEQWPGSAWMLQTFGVTKTHRTAYDHTMLYIHNIMKSDDIYQQTVMQSEFRFPAGSTWIVYTDRVSHAAMAGQHVLEQTFYLPVSAMTNPSKAPLKILERLSGRPLI